MGEDVKRDQSPVFLNSVCFDLPKEAMLTESLVVVLRIARQSEQRRSHLLAALVQVLATNTERRGGSRLRSPHYSEMVGFTCTSSALL